MDEHNLIVIVSILCATFGGGYTWYVVTKAQTRARELLSAERLAAIERGLPPPEEPASAGGKKSRSQTLAMGIWWLSLGLGLIVAVLIAVPGRATWAWGLIVVAMGVSDLVYWFVRGKAEAEETQRAEQETRDAFARRSPAGKPTFE